MGEVRRENAGVGAGASVRFRPNADTRELRAYFDTRTKWQHEHCVAVLPVDIDAVAERDLAFISKVVSHNGAAGLGRFSLGCFERGQFPAVIIAYVYRVIEMKIKTGHGVTPVNAEQPTLGRYENGIQKKGR